MTTAFPSSSSSPPETSELQDGSSNSTYVKAVRSRTNRLNLTDNVDDINLNSIYSGGYGPVLDRLEAFKRVKIDGEKNVLTAAVSDTSLSSRGGNGNNSSSSRNNPTITLDGQEIGISDIIAKSAIPYPKSLKKRFINAVETDQVINTVFNIYSYFIFNVSRKSTLRPVGYYRAKNIGEVTEMLNEIVPVDVQDTCVDFLDNVDSYSRVWSVYAPLAFKHWLTFGIGSFFKELINDTPIANPTLKINIPVGTPALLKTVNPFYFEKLYIHRKTFKPLFLEYTDQQYKITDDEIFSNGDVDQSVKEQYAGWKSLVIRDPNDNQGDRKTILLPLNQMVVFKNSTNVAPNIEYFGTSRIFPILAPSEINRDIHYNILPSVNKQNSSGSGILSAPDLRNKQKMEEISADLEEGANYIVTNLRNLDYKQIAINSDIQGVGEQRFANVRQILMGLHFPSPFVNFENLTNRDTVRIISEFFKSTNLDPMRNMVSDTMSEQWYMPLIVHFFNNMMDRSLNGDMRADPPEPIGNNPSSSGRFGFIDLKLQIISEFESIDFAVFEDKLAALDPISFLTDAEKREMLRLEPYPQSEHGTEPLEKMNMTLKEISKVSNSSNEIEAKKQEVADLTKQLKEAENTFTASRDKQRKINKRNIDQNVNQ